MDRGRLDYRRARWRVRAPAEVLAERVFRAGRTSRSFREKLLEFGYHDRVNHFSAGPFQLRDGAIEDFTDLLEVFRVGL